MSKWCLYNMNVPVSYHTSRKQSKLQKKSNSTQTSQQKQESKTARPRRRQDRGQLNPLDMKTTYRMMILLLMNNLYILLMYLSLMNSLLQIRLRNQLKGVRSPRKGLMLSWIKQERKAKSRRSSYKKKRGIKPNWYLAR